LSNRPREGREERRIEEKARGEAKKTKRPINPRDDTSYRLPPQSKRGAPLTGQRETGSTNHQGAEEKAKK